MTGQAGAVPARCYSPSAQGGHHPPRQIVGFSADAHAGIALDAYRLLVTGGRVEEIAAVLPDRILLAQFCDVAGPAAPADYKRVACTTRLLPGYSVLPLVDLVRRLREMCYRGPMRLEVLNDDMTRQHPEMIATRAHALIARLLERAGW